MGGEQRILQVWHVGLASRREAESGECVPELLLQCKSAIHALSIDADGTMLAVGTSTHTELYEIHETALLQYMRDDAKEKEEEVLKLFRRSRSGGNQKLKGALWKSFEQHQQEDAKSKAAQSSAAKSKATREGPESHTSSSCPVTKAVEGLGNLLLDEDSQFAVIKIQAAMRGRQARKEVAERKKHQAEKHAPEKKHPKPNMVSLQAWSHEEHMAVMSIQSRVRGNQVRSRINKDKDQHVKRPKRKKLRRGESSLKLSRNSGRHAWSEPLYTVAPLLYLKDVNANVGGVSLCKNVDFGTMMLAIAGGHVVSLVDVETGAVRRQQTRVGRVRSIDLSSEGSILDGGFDREVRLERTALGASVFHYPAEVEGEKEVKSISLAEDGSYLAIGYDNAGKGLFELYDTRHGKRVLARQDEKPIWAVALSRDGKLLAAAGYSCKLKLLDTRTLAALLTIDYTAPGAPSFIWSLIFSADGSSLAVGCWDKHAYVYRVNADLLKEPHGTKALKTEPYPHDAPELLNQGDSSLILTETARVKRADRVYTVALDRGGQHMLVGGRDKFLALVRMPEAGEKGGQPETVWEVVSDDFVYTAALSDLRRFAAHSGPSHFILVLDGNTGTRLFRHDNGFTVWSLRMIGTNDGPKMAFAGESTSWYVMDLQRNEIELEMPAVDSGAVYAIATSSHSLGWSNGNRAMVLGRGGNCYGWQDQPSYRLITSLITELLSNEDQLLRCLTLIFKKHPSLALGIEPETGNSLLQFVVETCSRTPSVIEMMLYLRPQPIGLQPNMSGLTALHAAMAEGGWRAMQILQKAIIDGRIQLTKPTIEKITRVMCETAPIYPRDFLRFIEKMPLQFEPEIFIKSDEFEVVLPEIITAASSEFCPLGLWSEKLESLRVERDEEEDIEEMDEERIAMGFRLGMANGVKAYRIPFDSFASELTLSDDRKVIPLELICDSATETREYTIFGCRAVNLLLRFKWYGFARRLFMWELFWFLLVWVITTVYIAFVTHPAIVQLNYLELWQISIGTYWKDDTSWQDGSGLWSANGTSMDVSKRRLWADFNGTSLGDYSKSIPVSQVPITKVNMRMYAIFSKLGLLMTTLSALMNIKTEIAQMRNLGLRKYLTWWNTFDLLRIVPLLVANVLVVIAHTPALSHLAGTLYVYYTVLFSFTMLFFAFRAISFFRGFLSFATLVYSIGVILTEIVSFIIVLLVLFLGFSMALWLLMRDHVDDCDEDNVCQTNYGSLDWFFTASFSMGLFGTDMGEMTFSHILNQNDGHSMPSFFKAFFFILFNFTMQVVLLNLLIALMGEARAKAATEASLNAYRRRAELVLEQEENKNDQQKSNRRLKTIAWLFGCDYLFDQVDVGEQENEEEDESRWLHVLVPDEIESREEAQRQRKAETHSES